MINELSPSNVDVLRDEQGESVDWLELYNPGPEPADLTGWTLSDDPDEPDRWALPARTLEPGGFLLLYASGRGPERPVVTWDTRLDQGDPWRYLEVLAPPDPGWTRPEYDDSGWSSGPSGFGREDGDDATAVTAHTVYARAQLDLTAAELADLVSLFLHVDHDDAFVAYLNGVEVARLGIGRSGLPPAWDEWAKDEHEAALVNGEAPPVFDLAEARQLLVVGANTVAVEVHNLSAESRDLSLIPFVSLGFGTQRQGQPSPILDLAALQLHTSFELKADGEPVLLYDQLGCEADALDPGPLLADQSYGRKPDGSDVLGYFLEPTPGAANATESRPGFAETPTFDPPPGHHPGGADVRITAEPGAEIHYTRGGAEPTEQDPTAAEPVATGTDGEAVVLRARAYKDGLWPSRIATATYLLREPGTLPVVSLVTDPPNLWDEETGIYVFGSEYDPEPPYYGANFWDDREVPAHVEQWEPDGDPGFSVDAGLSTHGGVSRAHDQRNLLLQLRSGYGDRTIAHEVFPGLGIEAFDRVLLRAAGNDWLGCWMASCSTGAHLRDGLMHTIAPEDDLDLMAYRPCEVYLNGEYWGIYELRERPDDSYVADHHGEEDIDLLELDGKVIHGDGVHWQATLEWLRTHDLSDPESYAHVQTLIDVEELSAYLIHEIFYGNTDWPGNNYKYWRPRTADGRWRWFLYDTDFGLGADLRKPESDTLAFALEPNGPNWPNPPWSTELFRLLVQSPEFTNQFVNRYADYLNTTFAPEVTRAALDQAQAVIAPEIPRQIERWGTWTDGVTTRALEPGVWEKEVAWIDEWLGERPDHARNHLLTNFGLQGTWTLTLEADPPGSGTFVLTAVEVQPPFSGTYFLGVPVTVTAVPANGFRFVGWSDGALPADPMVTLDPAGPLTLVARFE